MEQSMHKLKIIASMLGRGAIYGAGLGTLTGCVLGLPLFMFGGFLGILIGLGVGLGIGAAMGLLIGILTALFFYPLKNIQRYKRSITLFCVALPSIVIPLAVQRFWWGHFTWRLDIVSIMFAVVAMVAGLAFSKWLITWYTREYQMNKASTFPITNE
jgi:hypothetical protein